MRLAMILSGAVTLLLLGGLAWLSLSDVNVQKTSITKTISNERFFDAN